MNKTWTKTAALVGLALATAGSIAACSPSKAEPTATESLVQGGASAAAETVTVTEDGVKAAPALDGSVSVLQDFQQTKCEGGPGKATAAGTVVNRGDKTRDIVATASWKTPDGKEPVAQASAVMKQVPAGQTRAFEITSNVPGKKGDVYLCGLRVDAGTLK